MLERRRRDRSSGQPTVGVHLDQQRNRAGRENADDAGEEARHHQQALHQERQQRLADCARTVLKLAFSASIGASPRSVANAIVNSAKNVKTAIATDDKNANRKPAAAIADPRPR